MIPRRLLLSAALPLLLMRQDLEADIERQLSAVRRQIYFPQIA